MVMTIVEFLTARLDEEERTAAECAKVFPAPWVGAFKQVTSEPSGLSDASIVADTYHSAASHHIERQEPSHVLADIAAKRAIVAWCAERDQIYVGTAASDPDDPGPDDFVPGYLTNPAGATVLRHLASVYSDHRDYREEWKC